MGPRRDSARTEAPDEDAADVSRVLAGDTSAFAGIVQRWQGRLVGLAWRFCGDRAMAEDLAQEAFVKAFRALQSFRGDAAFSTWLTAIALNTYRSALRHRDVPVQVVDTGTLPHEASPDALAALEAQERSAAIRRLVLALPPRYRAPIVLYHFEEHDVATIARALRLPEGTVKARLHRGRAILRRRMDAQRGHLW